MISTHRILVSLFALFFAVSLASCGDTWRGLKKDTGENLQRSGEAVERAGEKVEP